MRVIRAGRCRERRYADHIFIQIYFRMHHFVVKYSKKFSPQAARGIDPPSQNPADPLIACRRRAIIVSVGNTMPIMRTAVLGVPALIAVAV